MIEELRQWLRTSPYIKNENEFNINFLGGETTAYSLETVPGNNTLRRYLDGSEIEQRSFVLATREAYGVDVIDNIETTVFFEGLTDWINKQNKNKHFFEIDNGKVLSVGVSSSYYLYSEDYGTARYQMQLSVTIHRKGVYK